MPTRPQPTDATQATEPPATPSAGGGATIVTTVADAVMHYYDITGATSADLRAAMTAQGPVDADGHRNDAFTQWNIDWTWPLNPDRTCILGSATITATITVTFPRWLPPPGASASLVVAWNTYQQALVVHESGHVAFVIAEEPVVLAAIKGATCDTAEGAAEAVVARIRQHDIDYDAETNHGFTQGAHFP